MKVLFSSVFVVVMYCGAAAAAGTKVHALPKEVDLCKRADDACLLKAVQKALSSFKNGLPKLGVLSVDPLRVTEMNIDQGTGPVSIKLSFRNQDIIGIANCNINYAKGEFADKTMKIEIRGDIPRLTLEGDYVVGGRVLVLPIQGEGKDNLTLTDVNAKIILKGHVEERDGEDYMKIDDLKLSFKTKRLYIDLQNLFNGDKRLGDNMIVFLNENWSDILSELQPSIEEALGEILKEISNRVYSKVPYKNIHLV